MRVVGAPVLDADDRVVELAGQLTGLAAIDGDVLALVAERADRRDHGRGAGAPHLAQAAVAPGLHHLVDRDRTLGDRQPPVAHQLQRRRTRHAIEDGARERRRDHLVADAHHDVHGADFVEEAALHAIQVQHLRIARLRRILLARERLRVVRRGLRLAGAAAHRAHMAVGRQDAHRLHAFLVVGPDRREDQEVQVAVRRMHAQHHVGRDDGRPQVERRARLARHPVRIHADQRVEGCAHDVDRHLRHAHDLRGAVEALRVAIGAEQPDLPVIAAERLEPVEDRLAVVQHRGRGIEAERPVGFDAGVEPAAAFLVVHQEHVVGQHLAETQRIIRRLRLRRGGARCRERAHAACPSRFLLRGDGGLYERMLLELPIS